MSPEIMQQLEIKHVLADADNKSCFGIMNILAKEVKKEEENQNQDIANGWRFLSSLCGLVLQPSNTNEPFLPFMRTTEGRTLLPEDLDPRSIQALREIVDDIDLSELSARINDIIWLSARDPEAARNAVMSYFVRAKQIYDEDTWPPFIEKIERALRLSQIINDKDWVQYITNYLEEVVLHLNGSDEKFLTAKCMKLLYEFSVNDAAAMADIARKAATNAYERGEFRIYREHMNNLANWQKQNEGEKSRDSILYEIAQSHEIEGDSYEGDYSSFFAERCYKEAYNLYRRLRCHEDRERVYNRMRLCQKTMTKQMIPIKSDKEDISKVVKEVRNRISGKTFEGAITEFALIKFPTDFEEKKEDAKQMLEEFPLQGLFGGVKLDEDGRVVGQMQPSFGDHGDNENAVWQKVIQMMDLDYQINSHAIIIPAINQISVEHSITVYKVGKLFYNIPNIPEGNRDIVIQGIYYGLQFRFIEALSILVPQLEPVLRCLMEQHGLETTKMNNHGIQSRLTLSQMLSQKYEELSEFIDKNILEEMKVLFLYELGPNIRNELSHGGMREHDFFHHTAIYTFWFLMWFFLYPYTMSRAKDT